MNTWVHLTRKRSGTLTKNRPVRGLIELTARRGWLLGFPFKAAKGGCFAGKERGKGDKKHT